jgi:hypothetical protein
MNYLLFALFAGALSKLWTVFIPRAAAQFAAADLAADGPEETPRYGGSRAGNLCGAVTRLM